MCENVVTSIISRGVWVGEEGKGELSSLQPPPPGTYTKAKERFSSDTGDSLNGHLFKLNICETDT